MGKMREKKGKRRAKYLKRIRTPFPESKDLTKLPRNITNFFKVIFNITYIPCDFELIDWHEMLMK